MASARDLWGTSIGISYSWAMSRISLIARMDLAARYMARFLSASARRASSIPCASSTRPWENTPLASSSFFAMEVVSAFVRPASWMSSSARRILSFTESCCAILDLSPALISNTIL